MPQFLNLKTANLRYNDVQIQSASLNDSDRHLIFLFCDFLFLLKRSFKTVIRYIKQIHRVWSFSAMSQGHAAGEGGGREECDRGKGAPFSAVTRAPGPTLQSVDCVGAHIRLRGRASPRGCPLPRDRTHRTTARSTPAGSASGAQPGGAGRAAVTWRPPR